MRKSYSLMDLILKNGLFAVNRILHSRGGLIAAKTARDRDPNGYGDFVKKSTKDD
jgi:hypothetical protein